MEKITIKNHLNDLQLSTSRMLVYHSDNAELLTYFKNVTFKLQMIEELINAEDSLDFAVIEEAFKTILKQDNELTNIEINIQVKPALKEIKIGKIKAKLFNYDIAY
jgi:hypothetical protein